MSRSLLEVTRGRIRLLRQLTVARRWLVVGMLTAYTVEALLPAINAWVTGHLVTVIGDDPDGSRLRMAILLLGSCMFAINVTSALRAVITGVVIRRIDGWTRQRVRQLARTPEQIGHLESETFQDDARRAADPGKGVGRTRSVGTAAVGQVTLLFKFLGAVAAAVVVATFSVPLAVALLTVSVFVRARVRRQWIALVAVKDAQAHNERRLGYLTRLTVGQEAKEVKLFGLAHWVTRRRQALAYHAAAPTWRALWRVLRHQKLTIFLLAGSAGLALWIPASAVLDGRIDAGRMVTMIVAGWAVLAIGFLGFEAFDIEYGLGAVSALDRLMLRHGHATVSDRLPPPATPVAPQGVPEVRFEHVHFAYRDGRPVLDDLCLTLSAGERVALVGPNGVGKTTLIKLLAGLYQPTAGRITVDGHDLRDLDLADWRRSLATVFQDFLRYPASIADNVALAAPEAVADRAGVEQALQAAGADFVGRLPEGLDTSLWRAGSEGTELSGGEWQRIAIARALFAVRNGRRILVLDEPTAHLDVRAETAFYQHVVSSVSTATVVLISHRLSTVRSADRIVLLRAGRIAEQGSHDELMATDGEYRRMFLLQGSRFTDTPAAQPQSVGRH
ncbi:ABC transporter ATP-binding protein [Micromonospora lutea]|uniref:Multidrug ABC transporter permease n=1 Tax=Micromonospora lutea TaxID=419825 RepID=A0ABQ4ISY9_9ACTN|nr:ABC transporter ATP-binding protein [Micromonospora lutea]GIJ21042.1 multidrug ABC transporter permease [Micromonospora lutea]